MPTAPESPEPEAGRAVPGEPTGSAVQEQAVWLEVNGRPAVTWMCTPAQLEELAVGWLHGEGYIRNAGDVRLRPCATDLGFWAEIPEDLLRAVEAERRRPVLASGCGAVATYLADPSSVDEAPSRGDPPDRDRLRGLFKRLFHLGERYQDTGGVHAAALTDDTELLFHAEDIGRHNAVDKVIGSAILARTPIPGLGLLVTGRISAELAFKAARAGVKYVATPSVPSTLAVEIARRAGMTLVGRAVSAAPQLHRGGTS
jgi:FdhD protein